MIKKGKKMLYEDEDEGDERGELTRPPPLC